MSRSPSVKTPGFDFAIVAKSDGRSWRGPAGELLNDNQSINEYLQHAVRGRLRALPQEFMLSNMFDPYVN